MNNNLGFEVLELGNRYSDKQTNQCFVKIDYDNQWRLMAGMPNLKSSEVRDFESGELQIGMADIDNKIFIVYKFGSQPWGDTPYDPRLLLEPFEYPQIKDRSLGAPLCVELYDSATGVLKVLRLLGLPNELSNNLHFRCTELAALGRITRATNERQVAQIYQKFRNSEDMLKHVDKIYTIGD